MTTVDYIGIQDGGTWIQIIEPSWNQAFSPTLAKSVQTPSDQNTAIAFTAPDENLLQAAGCALVGGETIAVVAIVAGNFWYGTTSPPPGPANLQHVHGPNNEGRGDFTAISCTASGRDLQVAGLIGGQVWHNILRGQTNTWQGFLQAPGMNGLWFEAIACAGGFGSADDVHFVAIGGNANLYHTIRHGDGSWQGPGFAHVYGPDNGHGEVDAVACSKCGGDLHVFALCEGHLTHGVRHGSDGSWDEFGLVAGGDHFTAVAAAQTADQMNVCVGGITDNPLVWNGYYNTYFPSRTLWFNTCHVEAGGQWDGWSQRSNEVVPATSTPAFHLQVLGMTVTD